MFLHNGQVLLVLVLNHLYYKINNRQEFVIGDNLWLTYQTNIMEFLFAGFASKSG